MEQPELSGKRVLVGVCGGIAAYKSCELVRLLIRAGAEVQAVLTPRAAQFVTPLTFAALTGLPAPVDEFPAPGEPPRLDVYSHLNLTRRLDCYVISPATAATLAKLVTGQADNLVTGSYLSCTAPVVIAPAMNTRMWQHPAVQESVARLKQRGDVLVMPGEGALACGDTGAGRLAELEEIYAAVRAACLKPQPDSGGPLKGKRVIVTAGGTREYLDPVRFITNASSGRLGLEVADALLRRGAEVELIETGIEVPAELAAKLSGRETVRTSFDLQRALADSLSRAEILVMLAAVADYGPVSYSNIKRKKDGRGWTVELAETADILRQAAEARRPGQVFCGVSLEDTDWLARAVKKCTDKHVDLMLAVELGADLPFGDNKLECALVTREGVAAPPLRRSKADAAALLAAGLEKLAADAGAK